MMKDYRLWEVRLVKLRLNGTVGKSTWVLEMLLKLGLCFRQRFYHGWVVRLWIKVIVLVHWSKVSLHGMCLSNLVKDRNCLYRRLLLCLTAIIYSQIVVLSVSPTSKERTGDSVSTQSNSCLFSFLSLLTYLWLLSLVQYFTLLSIVHISVCLSLPLIIELLWGLSIALIWKVWLYNRGYLVAWVLFQKDLAYTTLPNFDWCISYLHVLYQYFVELVFYIVHLSCLNHACWWLSTRLNYFMLHILYFAVILFLFLELLLFTWYQSTPSPSGTVCSDLALSSLISLKHSINITIDSLSPWATYHCISKLDQIW